MVQESVGQNGTVLRSNVGEYQFADQHFQLCWNMATRLRRDPELKRASYILAGLSQPFAINGEPASGISLRTQGAAVVSSSHNDLCHLELNFQVEIDVAPSVMSVHALHAKCLADGLARANVDYCSNAYAQIEHMMLRRPGKATVAG